MFGIEPDEESIPQSVELQLFVDPLLPSSWAVTSKLSGLPCSWLPLLNVILSSEVKPSRKKVVHETAPTGAGQASVKAATKACANPTRGAACRPCGFLYVSGRIMNCPGASRAPASVRTGRLFVCN